MKSECRLILAFFVGLVCGPGLIRSAQADMIRGTTALKSGETKTLATLLGPAQIVALHIKIAPVTRFTLRQTVLRMTWDGAKNPAVAVPLGDFFGAVYEAKSYKSEPLAVAEGELVCTLPMPFADTARIALWNAGTTPLTAVTWNIETKSLAKFDTKSGWFHAAWLHEKAAANQPLVLAEISGAGKWLGMSLALQGAPDMKLFSAERTTQNDGAEFVSTMNSTFTRGPVGEAYSQAPLTTDLRGNVCTSLRPDRGRFVGHLFWLENPVPFQKSLRHSLTDAAEPLDCAATAYWVQNSPEGSGAKLDPNTLTLPTFYLADVIEAESLTVEGTAKITDDTALAGEASGGKLLVIPDTGVTMTLNVPKEGDYNLGFGLLNIQNGATRIDFALGDEPFDPLSQLTQIGLGDLPLGGNWTISQVLHFKAGRQTVRLRPEKGRAAFLDFVRLDGQEPIKPEKR